LATVIYVVIFAVYFVFKPPIFSELYKQTLWFTNTYTQKLPREDEQNHDPGYLKIVFYFYQVTELVMMKSPEKALHLVPFIPPVIAIFNFQVKTLDGSIGCPFPGLNVVTKEMLLCSKFLATLLSIGFIYAFHLAASKSRYISQPSLTLYLTVALETLLFGYERLADTALKLMHYVPIAKDWCLFVDGNIQCWQWWQYLMIAFIVGFINPLLLVLFWGSLMRANDKISVNEFLIACVFPLPCLFAWMNRHFTKTQEQIMLFTGNFNHPEEMKKILHGSFRKPSKGDNGTLYWESVLTGRSFILLTIHTFATDPVVRFACLNCACVAILVHHVPVRPFRDHMANVFESLSLLSLVAICTFSLAEANYLSEGTASIGPVQNLLRALQWIEISLLGLVPAAVCILVVLVALSQVLRLLYHCIRLLSYVLGCKCFFPGLSLRRFSSSQPLLLNWD